LMCYPEYVITHDLNLLKYIHDFISWVTRQFRVLR
jgi:hypothetical protein